MKIFITGFKDCGKDIDAIEVLKTKISELGLDVNVQVDDVFAHCSSLLDADIVYFVDGWFKYSKCRIDFNICVNSNKTILFQKALPIYDDYRKTINLQGILHEITGVTFDDIRSSNRKQDFFFARTLFVWYCFKHLKLRLTRIAQIINRDHSTIYNYMKKYDELMDAGNVPEFKKQQSLLMDKMNVLHN